APKSDNRVFLNKKCQNRLDFSIEYAFKSVCKTASHLSCPSRTDVKIAGVATGDGLHRQNYNNFSICQKNLYARWAREITRLLCRVLLCSAPTGDAILVFY
ncbi:MAG: hypothetical protein K2H48_02215, partial [Duncaniella sp.]|nr:hypothetical protein [Duncaniella sp.]